MTEVSDDELDAVGEGLTEMTNLNNEVVSMVETQPVLNDGLLCSILQTMSGAPNPDYLINHVLRDCDLREILMARKKLFSHYNEIKCPNQQKPILEIQRKSTRAYVKDIVDQMVKVDKKVEVNMFCLPWDYVLKPVASDSELITQEMEKQVSEEIDIKINALEQRLNEKHRVLHDSILASVNKALKEKCSSCSRKRAATWGARPRT